MPTDTVASRDALALIEIRASRDGLTLTPRHPRAECAVLNCRKCCIRYRSRGCAPRTITQQYETGPTPGVGMSDGWQDKAACRNYDPELWFAKDRRISKAQNICLSCPVARECLEQAMSLGNVEGVWGALTPEGRRMWRDYVSHTK